MSTQANVQNVQDFFAAMGRGDRQGLLALAAEDIEWIIPGEDWPLAICSHRGGRRISRGSPPRTPRTSWIPNHKGDSDV